MKGLILTTREQTRLTIMNLILDRRYPVSEAARLIGLSERHTWRILAAYRREGAAALAHGNRGRLPWNSKDHNLLQRVTELARDRYQGFNQCHLTEILAEREGILLSRSTVRRFLLAGGLSSPRRRRGPHHRCRRQRMPQEGMLVQIDGSPHDWLEGRGSEFTLLLAIDDATGTVPYALFNEQEDTIGYLRLIKGIIERRGIPLALYSDRSIIFRSATAQGGDGEPPPAASIKATHFGCAMKELGVIQVFAQSPEAKGRIERANGTFQDRLVSELRLAGASTMAEANAVLETFLSRFNERFAVPASQPGTAYRQLGPELDMDSILCLKEYRRVAKDNTVRYHGQTLQIYPDADHTTYARRRVEVQQRLDGQLKVSYRGRVLTPGDAPPLAAELRHLSSLPLPAPVYEPEEPDEPEIQPPAQPQIRKIWWEDSEQRRLHGEQTKAGLVKARERGKRLGRPRVDESLGFDERFSLVFERITSGEMTRTNAAREMAMSSGTLRRVLETWIKAGKQPSPRPVVESFYDIDALAEVAD
jgi:transposase